MATKVVLGAAVARCKQILSPVKTNAVANRLVLRRLVQTESGALPPYPEQTRFGLIKVTTVVVPVVTFGGYLSMEFAAWLEDTELFVPNDDDDD